VIVVDSSWNFFDPTSRPTLYGVLRREMDAMIAMASDPQRWEAPTACEGWQVRDVIGHLVDTTEGYLPAFEIARAGGVAPEPTGLRVMARRVDESAKAFRKLPQNELLERLRDDMARMWAVFDGLSDDDWNGLQVPHPYMGPLPALFYPIFQLVDYAVHSWDVREGTGRPHALEGDAADLLAPLMFVLWQATADTSNLGEPFTIGVRTTGRNGGDCHAEVTSAGVTFTPGDLDGCAAVLELDPATLVLTAYGRMRGGTVRGNPELATRFLSLFFPI
jgi:uncharacterized protein (TIGR03083 family)